MEHLKAQIEELKVHQEQNRKTRQEMTRLRFAVYAMAAVLEVVPEEDLDSTLAENHRVWLIAKKRLMDLTVPESEYLNRLQARFEERENAAVPDPLLHVNELRRSLGLPELS